MHNVRIIGAFSLLLMAVGNVSCSKKAATTQAPQPTPQPSAAAASAADPNAPNTQKAGLGEVIAPLPLSPVYDRAKFILGRKLYFDKALSKDGTLACASCHQLEKGGADAERVSTGIGGAQGPINAPTVFNARYNFVQFWNGRASSLAHQAGGPVENPNEMGESWPNVVKKIKKNKDYVALFKESFAKEGITKDTITAAIAEYENGIVTPSRFDKFLRGEPGAITVKEYEGYQLFKSVGCPTCHQGINVGGAMYQKMGLVRDYFKERGGELTEADLGRFAVTKQESDKHFFKVPSLRNVELTAPYFHDGHATALDQAVTIMARVQLGRDLKADEADKIVAFLKSLTGEVPKHCYPDADVPEDAGREVAEPCPTCATP